MPALDLGPQAPLPCPAQLYLFSACLRAVYYSSFTWREIAFQAAGNHAYYESSLSDPSYPKWSGADYGPWQLVCIEGTTGALSEAQWLGNVFAAGQQGFAAVPGRVHQYFGNVGVGLAGNVLAVMASALQNCVLIGHSLGGAAALIAAHVLNASRPGSVKFVVTFGAPKAGNLPWALGQPWPVLRLENVGDPVAMVPPQQGWVANQVSDLTSWGPCQTYYAAGEGWQLDGGGGLGPAVGSSLAQTAWATAVDWWTQGSVINALPHATGNYAQRVRYWLGPTLPGGKPRGIDVGQVDGFQKAFGAVDGFVWTNP